MAFFDSRPPTLCSANPFWFRWLIPSFLYLILYLFNFFPTYNISFLMHALSYAHIRAHIFYYKHFYHVYASIQIVVDIQKFQHNNWHVYVNFFPCCSKFKKKIHFFRRTYCTHRLILDNQYVCVCVCNIHAKCEKALEAKGIKNVSTNKLHAMYWRACFNVVMPTFHVKRTKTNCWNCIRHTYECAHTWERSVCTNSLRIRWSPKRDVLELMT